MCFISQNVWYNHCTIHLIAVQFDCTLHDCIAVQSLHEALFTIYTVNPGLLNMIQYVIKYSKTLLNVLCSGERVCYPNRVLLKTSK